jgi:hypothetical protein
MVDRMESSKVNNYTKAFFSVVTALAIGFWTLYEHYDRKAEKADEALPHLSVEMVPKIIGKKGDKSYISIELMLVNSGTNSIKVALDDKAMYTAKIDFTDSKPIFTLGKYIGNTRLRIQEGFRSIGKYIEVGPKETYHIAYALEVKGSGMYLLRFLTEMGQALGNVNYGAIGADKFIYVGD